MDIETGHLKKPVNQAKSQLLPPESAKEIFGKEKT